MSFLLVQLSHDYSDEFEVVGAFVISKLEFEAELKKLQAAFNEGKFNYREFYFGTNEFLSFNTFDDFIRGVTMKECTEQFYHEFIAVTGGCIGFCVMDEMLEYIPGVQV